MNNDASEAIPEDYDKMAACQPDDAIWIVMNRTGGHRVVQALNNPWDGEPRVEKSYSENTLPHQFQIDTDGLTGVYPIRYVQSILLDGDEQ